ncbi:MAG: family metallopeptidase [Paucimonas sp.]|nr:family metallopeptidase [Paucimonas sp.]
MVAPLPAQNLPNLGDTERSELSPVMERKLGERIMTDLRRDKDYLDDRPLQEYLNSLGTSLINARPETRGEASYDFSFFAVRDPMLNAFALPGGFIGVHTGLLLAAQNESELASVLSHEIGHVSQRHIARMIGNQRQDSLIPLAGILLAALTARASPDMASAALMGGQGLAIQRQLNFNREAEREADRVGLQIMRDGGYDTSGMVAFFGRLQSSARSFNDTAPAYLRTHPLTTERIADIQARINNDRYRQHADNGDFQLMRARARVLQDTSAQGLREAAAFFQNQVQQRNRAQLPAARYGLALVALRQGDAPRAQALLDEARGPDRANGSAAMASLAIEVAAGARRHDDAVKLADEARRRFPLSRGIAAQYGEALLQAGRNDEAVRYLRDQVELYRNEADMQQKLARAYAAQGKLALQHMALAESYALGGGIPAALDQLALARRAPDASFYDQSVIDARERDLRAQRLEQLRDETGRR